MCKNVRDGDRNQINERFQVIWFFFVMKKMGQMMVNELEYGEDSDNVLKSSSRVGDALGKLVT